MKQRSCKFLEKKWSLFLCLGILLIICLGGCGNEIDENVTQADDITEELVSIEIQNPPTERKYESGDNFNPDGMVVVANYNTGKTEKIEDYSIIDGENLKLGTTDIVISYQGKTVVQSVEVNPAKLPVIISVKRTGNIITGIGKMHVMIDDEEVFTLDNNTTKEVEVIMTEGIHTIQTKGQGDISKKLKFEVLQSETNEFYYISEISNLVGVKLEEAKYITNE